MATTADRFGQIDILVNDAAIVPSVPWEELDFTEWRRVMSVNIDGVFLTCKAVYPHMKEAGYAGGERAGAFGRPPGAYMRPRSPPASC